MAEVQWYYARNDQQFGPVSAAELKQLADDGKLSPDDLLWREGMDSWNTAINLRGLFSDEAPPGKGLADPMICAAAHRSAACTAPPAGKRFASVFGSVLTVPVAHHADHSVDDLRAGGAGRSDPVHPGLSEHQRTKRAGRGGRHLFDLLYRRVCACADRRETFTPVAGRLKTSLALGERRSPLCAAQLVSSSSAAESAIRSFAEQHKTHQLDRRIIFQKTLRRGQRNSAGLIDRITVYAAA